MDPVFVEKDADLIVDKVPYISIDRANKLFHERNAMMVQNCQELLAQVTTLQKVK
jgi:hypothetical protein